MGYKVRRMVNLEFEDPEGGESLTVRLTSMTIGELQQGYGGDDAGQYVSANEVLAEHLVEWNAEGDDGATLPCDLAGVEALDIPLRDMIMGAFMTAVRSVPHPLVLRSGDGSPSEAPPMTPEDL